MLETLAQAKHIIYGRLSHTCVLAFMFIGEHVARSPAFAVVADSCAGITSAISVTVCRSQRFYYYNGINRYKTRWKVNKQQEESLKGHSTVCVVN